MVKSRTCGIVAVNSGRKIAGSLEAPFSGWALAKLQRKYKVYSTKYLDRGSRGKMSQFSILNFQLLGNESNGVN